MKAKTRNKKMSLSTTIKDKQKQGWCETVERSQRLYERLEDQWMSVSHSSANLQIAYWSVGRVQCAHSTC